MEKETVYGRLRAAMEYQKVSYQTLADRLGLSRMGLFKSMKNETLTINTMLAMCRELNLDPVELFQADALVSEPAAEYGSTDMAILTRLRKIHGLCSEIESIAQAKKNGV